MRPILTIFFLCCLSSLVHAQSHYLNVNNGYGSGFFEPGDTVYIWAREMAQYEVFDTWTGDTDLLSEPNEWRTTLVMPAQDVNLDAEFHEIPPYSTEYIQCVQSLKKVHAYFPPDPAGLVFLFHGTGGIMDIWVEVPDPYQVFKDLVASNFAVVVTEAEEITLGMDLNGDSTLRWITNTLTLSNNIDAQNIRALIDTFETRNLIAPDTKKYALGVSNGGSFATVVSFLLSFDAAAPYCIAGNPVVNSLTTVPTQWCMQAYDDNPSVGIEAYYTVTEWSENLMNNGVCSRVFLNDRSPIYPQIFARHVPTSVAQSEALFNELDNSGFLDYIDGYYYMNLYADTIFFDLVPANPSAYPLLSIIASNLETMQVVSTLMDGTHAGHKLYSSHDKRTIAFLNDPCGTVTAASDPLPAASAIGIYPNPAGDKIYFAQLVTDSSLSGHIYDLHGRLLQTFTLTNPEAGLDVSRLETGFYFIEVNHQRGKFFVGR